jgi:release factor glutamine methyltransferase
MNITEFFKKYKNLPRHELEVLLHLSVNLSKKDIFMNPELDLNLAQVKSLEHQVDLLQKNYPLAYIVNRQDFYGYEFNVNESVLIPRPETEVLVSKCLDLDFDTVLDIGTGTGCIAISINLQKPNSTVSALDISIEALKVAKENSKKHNINIEFILSDLLDSIPVNSHFDLIVTNPPYVKDSDQEHMSASTLDYEPHLALFSGPDGLDFYRKLFIQLSEKKISFNYLCGEFGFNQETEMTDLLELHFSGKYILFKDLNKITRFFKISN